MANTWTPLGNVPAPAGGFSPDTMLLLTDGSVLVHDGAGANGGNNWFRLAPDGQGNYATGTWSGPFAMTNHRQFFATGILMDGRLFALGGEYSDDLAFNRPGGDNGTAYGVAGQFSPLGEIFDPVTNTWSAMSKPAAFNWILGDTVSCVLADGRVLFGSTVGPRTALWDPVTNDWREAGLGFGARLTPSKNTNTDEETWVLLTDGTVLTVDITNAPLAEVYNPATDLWGPADQVPATLPALTLMTLPDTTVPPPQPQITIQEIGGAVVLPDKRVFFLGGTGRTGLYTAAASAGNAGTWTAGASLPLDTTGNNFNSPNGNLQTAIDAACLLLPSGRVLFVGGNTVRRVSPSGSVSFWSNPATVYVYDPITNATPTALTPQPPNNNIDGWNARLLLLPTGQVFFTAEQSGVMSLLTPDPAILGAPNASWKPVITNAPSTLVTGRSAVLTGQQFNGLSQACSYGDDAQMATNYPIVRLTNTATNAVVYLRSYNFSTLGIATQATPVSCTVDVPSTVPPGQYNLVVIANGIASNAAAVQVVAQDCFFLLDRSTFAQGEIQALINLNGAPAVFDPAVYVVVEGFKPSQLQLTAANLGNPPIKPNIPSPVAGVTLAFSGPVIPEDPSLPDSPQRFTFPFRVSFADTSMFGFAPSTQTEGLTATLTAAGNTVSAAANLLLIKNPNPFILHGDVANGHPWYLSVDIRVFMMKANQTKFGAHLAATGAARTVATTFITQAINNLNASPGSAGALFDAVPPDENAASLALAPTDVNGVAVYNFAVARVRYRDTIAASNVRLFFRMWPAQQTGATYNTSTLYRSTSGASPIPLLGVVGDEIMTIPFFATPRVATATTASMTSQTDPPNLRPTITASPIGGEVDSYYGCWLDINQPNEKLFPVRMVGGAAGNIPDGPFTGMGQLLSIQELVRSQHQCLLAEVSFNLAPIGSGADPSTSDKLAQRNLAFVNVPNPGHVDSRRAPQTFEVRPTPARLPRDLKPDELMIEWGNLPHGSTAQIYLPDVQADEVLSMARQLYATHRLVKVDAHTIECQTGGVTYLPIPRRDGPDFPGLLTLDLPPTVRKGQTYKVVIKQVTSSVGRGQPVYTLGKEAIANLAQGDRALSWRRVLGVFQLTIPVSTRQELLQPEERLLSVMKWIGQSIPSGSRWYLVFKRYLEQLGGRVRQMGGDPDRVPADPNGGVKARSDGDPDKDDHKDHDKERDEHQRRGHEHELKGRDRDQGEERLAFRGRVVALVYGSSGAFAGFLLETEDGVRRFESNAGDMEELAERARVEGIHTTVYAEREAPDRPSWVVLGNER